MDGGGGGLFVFLLYTVNRVRCINDSNNFIHCKTSRDSHDLIRYY